MTLTHCDRYRWLVRLDVEAVLNGQDVECAHLFQSAAGEKFELVRAAPELASLSDPMDGS